MKSSLASRLCGLLILTAASPLFAAPPANDLILNEDFETTAVGEVPAGYIKNGAVAVAEDAAHSGKHALRMEAATRGARRIVKAGPEIEALGSEHWGRLYFKVQQPLPAPQIPEGKTSGVIHSTIVSGKATSPLANDPIEVRPVDTLLGTDGLVRFIYNVQPKLRPEFATSSKERIKFTSEWILAEWHVDYATQTYEFFYNGEPTPQISMNKGAGKFEAIEIAEKFESLAFGWNNYQPAEPGIVAWIDDIALAKKRIGPTPEKSAAKK